MKIRTGVLTTHIPEYLGEDTMNSLSPAYEQHCLDCPNEYHDECWESTPDDVELIGFIFDPETGMFDIDPNAEYSAIVGSPYTQVVKSNYISNAAMASLCYPDQCDLGTPGEYPAYNLPPDVWGNGDRLPIQALKLKVRV